MEGFAGVALHVRLKAKEDNGMANLKDIEKAIKSSRARKNKSHIRQSSGRFRK
jgi:hypothetical protein